MSASEGIGSDPARPGEGGAELDLFAAELRQLAAELPRRLEAEPEDIDTAVARLVLTLVEFVRRLLEHQAVRRMEGGGLSDGEVERLGLALMRLEERIREVKETFGVADADLNIDLGPLGRLL